MKSYYEYVDYKDLRANIHKTKINCSKNKIIACIMEDDADHFGHYVNRMTTFNLKSLMKKNIKQMHKLGYGDMEREYCKMLHFLKRKRRK